MLSLETLAEGGRREIAALSPRELQDLYWMAKYQVLYLRHLFLAQEREGYSVTFTEAADGSDWKAVLDKTRAVMRKRSKDVGIYSKDREVDWKKLLDRTDSFRPRRRIAVSDNIYANE